MRNKKGQMNVGTFVMLAVIVIVILVLIQAIFSSQTTLTAKSNIVNESVTLVNARIDSSGSINNSYYFNLANGCPQSNDNWRLTDTSGCALSGIVIKLANGTTLTETTHYVINTTGGLGKAACTSSSGDIRFVNGSLTTSMPNQTYISYTYCQDGYITNSGSRNIAGIIGLFAAIALMIFIVVAVSREWF